MFGLGKVERLMFTRSKPHMLYGENYQHQTHREDWDALNRELFAEVIEKWPINAVALISNSNLGSTSLSSPFIRLQPEVDPELRKRVIAFTNEYFQKIFELAKDKYPDVADCYRVRNLGLPNNALVYLIEHFNGQYRTMLVFGGTRLRGKLEQRLEVVNQILANEPLSPKKGEGEDGSADAAAGAAAPERTRAHKPEEPPGFTLTNMRSILTASEGQLVEREEWLEARVGNLDYRQRVELEKIQAELRRRSKRRG